MWHYLKFCLIYTLLLPFIIGLSLGGWWMSLALGAFLLFIVLGDLCAGDDTSEPPLTHSWFLNALLFSALPFMLLMFLALMWVVSPHDLFGYGQWFQAITGYDALAARANNLVWHYLPLALGAALLIGTIGTVPAHELVHRISHRSALITGRWLLAFSWDAAFSIEHVYGHHRFVATAQDPATAPRGRTVYKHILCSTVGGNLSAWRIEKQRLTKKQLRLLSYHNRFLRGVLMSLVLCACAFALAGWQGLLMFNVCALLAKATLETVNYIEHYGMTRDIKAPVKPYHSWNSNKRISSWASFNLTRHSHHHARAQLPYYQLKPYPEAPMLPTGYLGSMLLALIPPLWFRFMAPKLECWDQQYGSPATPSPLLSKITS